MKITFIEDSVTGASYHVTAEKANILPVFTRERS